VACPNSPLEWWRVFVLALCPPLPACGRQGGGGTVGDGGGLSLCNVSFCPPLEGEV